MGGGEGAMQRTAVHRGHASTASSLAPWPPHTSCTFLCAPLSVVQGSAISGTATTSLVEALKGVDTAAQARCDARLRGLGATTVLPRWRLQRTIRCLQSSRLLSTTLLITQQCAVYTAPSPPAPVEFASRDHSDSDAVLSAPLSSAAAMTTSSASRRLVHRHRGAKRATDAGETPAASDEKRESEETAPHRCHLRHTSSGRRWRAGQPLSAAAPVQRSSQTARQQECFSDAAVVTYPFVRFPSPPTREDATPESIGSYLLTLRRQLTMHRTGRQPRTRARRAALVFMREALPFLMAMPPVPQADMLTGMMAAAATPAAVTPSTRPEDDAAVTQNDVVSEASHNSTHAALAGVCVHPAFPYCSPPPVSHTNLLEACPVHSDASWSPRKWGKGTVPWTEALAEAVLLMCNKLDLDVRALWVARAALLYLVSNEGRGCADARQQGSPTLSAIPSRLTSMPTSVLNDKAQLALALMRALDRNRRQSRLTREVLQPVAMRLALRLRTKRNGAASADGLGGRGGATTAPHSESRRSGSSAVGVAGEDKVASRASSASHAAAALRSQPEGSFVNLERYLAKVLLPFLYGAFVHYCCTMELLHDHNLSAMPATNVEATTAAAAAAVGSAEGSAAASRRHRHAPSLSVSDGRARLPKVSRSDIEAFSLLTAVLHRTLGLHGVVRCGDGIHFDLNEGSVDAFTAVAPQYREITSVPGGDLESPAGQLQSGQELSRGPATATPAAFSAPPRCERPLSQPAVPLRAFRLTIEAIVAQLEATGGPQTEALELAFSQSLSRLVSMGYTTRTHSPPPFVPPHVTADASAPRVLSDGSGGRSPPSTLSLASISKFGGAATSSRAQSPRASSATTPSPKTARKGGDVGREGHDDMTASSRPSPTTTTEVLCARFGSFTVDSFVPILNFCGHDHSFRLFLTTAVDDTGARGGTTSPIGSVTSAKTTTAAMPSARVEEDVSALATALSRLLLLGVYWAPLCRTYQLPSILALFARVATTELTHPAKETHALTVAASATASPHTASPPPTAASPPLYSARLRREVAPGEVHTEVLRQIRNTLLPPSDDLATPSSSFVQQLRRLAYSSGHYLDRFSFSTFVSISTAFDRVLSQWPTRSPAVTAVASACVVSGNTDVERGFANDGGEEGGSGGAGTPTTSTVCDSREASSDAAASSPHSHPMAARTAGTVSATDTAGASASHAKGPRTVFTAPVAAGMGTVTVLAAVTEEFWSRERGRDLWDLIAKRARRSNTAASSVTDTHRHRSSFLKCNVIKATHSVLRLTIPNFDRDVTEAKYVREGLSVPFYVLRQMGVSIAASLHTITPDELLRVSQTSEHVESYMAVLNGAGSTTATLPFIREYLSSDFMWRSIPNDAFAPLIATLMEMELASMTLPELLLLSGSLEGSTVTKLGQTSSSSLQGRLSGCLSLHTMLSLSARIEPHELRLLTAEGEDASRLREEANPRRLRELLDTDSCHKNDRSKLVRFTLRRISRDGCLLDPPPASASASRAALPRVGGRDSAASSFASRSTPSQGASGTRATRSVRGELACHACESVAEVLWESAYSRSSDQSARLPLAVFPPLLRSMLLLAEVERHADGAASHAAADRNRACASRNSSTCHTGAGHLDTRSVENILRMAYRFLFGSGAEVSAVAAPSTAVSLEALVTLYLSLTSAAKQCAASPHKRVENVSVAGEGVCESGSGTASMASSSLLLSVNCCLAHCISVLRPRLMAIALGTASSGAGDATYTEHERIATDLRVLLQLAVLAEGLLPCPATVAVPVTAAEGMSVDELIHHQLFRELGASLRDASLHRIAGEVSRMLWWVTRRAHAEAKGKGAAASLPPISWVETLLLREVEAKRLQMADCATTAAAATLSAASWSSATWHTFELFEWTLLPLYTKLEARQLGDHAAVVTTDRTVAAPPHHDSESAPLFDDFTSLEDAYSESSTGFAADALSLQPSSQGFATGSPSGVTADSAGVSSGVRATALAARGRFAVPHTAMLEAALHALPTQCDSFHILLHVVRQLFLSHPALLSTAPDATLYFELRTVCTAGDGEKCTTPTSPCDRALGRADRAVAGRQAWATLPVQRAELPRDLRQRYVDALFRIFKRLVGDCSCTTEELVELLHLLWLADPHASRVASSVSLSPMAATSQWPSLFSCCSGFVKKSLDDLDNAVSWIDSGGDFVDDSSAAASFSRHRSQPDVLQTVYRTVQYGLSKSILFKPLEAHWISISAAVLHPRSVVLFLHCLRIVQELGEQQRRQDQQQREHHFLSPSHNGALEVLQPFLIYASIAGEAMLRVPKMSYMPLVLEVLSEIHPPLVLALIHAVFAPTQRLGVAGEGRHGRRGGGDDCGRVRNRMLSGNALFYAKVVAGEHAGPGVMWRRDKARLLSPCAFPVGGWQDPRELSESIAATMAALLMVASHAQASSTVWSCGGKPGVHEDTYSAMIAHATAKQTLVARIGRAHQRALVFLRNALYRQLWMARARRPLQCVPEFMIIQVLQLAVVQESSRLLRLLEWLALGHLLSPVEKVGRTVLPAVANGPRRREGGSSIVPSSALSASSASGPAFDALAHHDSVAGRQYGFATEEDAAAKTHVTTTRGGTLLLRLLPLQCWRSLLHRGVSWPRYRGYPLQALLKSSRSLAAKRGENDPSDAVQDPAVQKRTELRASLASILLAHDAKSVAHLIAETMGPIVLLTVTTELLRVLVRQRACSSDSPNTARRDAENVTCAVSATSRNVLRTNDRQRATADKAPGGIAEPRVAKDDTPLPEALTSFEVVNRYASGGSVLNDEALQPWLKAACDVIDQLASTQHSEFVTVLEQEAAWQRRVAEASTYRSTATGETSFGVCDQTADDAVAAAKAAPGAHKGGAPESMAPVLDVGEDGVADLSRMGKGDEEPEGTLLGANTGSAAASDDATASGGIGRGVGEGGAMTAEFSTPATAADPAGNEWSGNSDTATEGPLVLDWRPICEFVRVVLQADPAILQRQARLEWWMLPATHSRPFSPVIPVDGSGSLAEAAVSNEAGVARDILHDAVGAILQHAREYRQTSDQVHGVRPLVMMNLCDALSLYPLDAQSVGVKGDSTASGQQVVPTYEDVAAKATSGMTVSAARDSTRDPVSGVDEARWLECGAGGSALVNGSDGPATSSSTCATTMVLGLTRPCRALSISSARAATVAVEVTKASEHTLRRLTLLRRAGVLASAPEMAQRYSAYGLSTAMQCDGAEAWQRTYAATFWRRQSQRLHREVLEYVFDVEEATEAARVRSHGSESVVAKNEYAGVAREEAATAAGQPVLDVSISDVERRVRRRLQFLRCHDLAQLLLLLTASSAPLSPSVNDGADEGMGALSSLRQLHMRVVMDTMVELLPSASTGELMEVVLALLKLSIPAASASATSADSTASQVLHYVRLEVRRLLANVAVLVANEVERFTFRELCWLITRLHTPHIRAAPAKAVTSYASSGQQTRGEAATRNEGPLQPTYSKPLGDQPLDVSMSYVSAAVARAIRVGIEGFSSLTDDERDDDKDDDDVDDTDGYCDGTAGLDTDVSVNVLSSSPVTVAQWTSAVAAAELQQGKSQMRNLLRLVELSAV